jgi:hypothetical protein
VTCKARHVKCDETRPACMRCLNFWGVCEGYAIKHKNLPRVPKLAAIAPKPAQRTSTYLEPSKMVDGKRVPINRMKSLLSMSISSVTGVKTTQEYRYLQLFQAETATELPGVFGGDLWGYLVMQASQKEDFVKDAVMAIGALSSCSRNLISVRQDSNIEEPRVVARSPEYQFALQKYGKSIREMQNRLKSGEKGIRTALIACLLVICFEGLQGNYFLAMEHAVSGGNLLQGWLEERSRPMNEPIEGDIVRYVYSK